MMLSTMSPVCSWGTGGLVGILLLMEARWRLQNYRFEQRRKRYPQIYAYNSKMRRSSKDIPPLQRSLIFVQFAVSHAGKALFYIAYEVLCRGVLLHLCKVAVNKLSSSRSSKLAKVTNTQGVLQRPPSGNRVEFAEHSNGQVQTKRIRYDPRATPSSNPTSVDIGTPPGKRPSRKPSRRATPKKVPKRNENKENERKGNVVSLSKTPSMNYRGTKYASTENRDYVSSNTALVRQFDKNQLPGQSTAAIVSHSGQQPQQAPMRRDAFNYAARPRIPVVAATPLSLRYSKRKLDHPSGYDPKQSRLPDKRGRIALPVSKRTVHTLSKYNGKRKAREEWILEEFKRTKPVPSVVPEKTSKGNTSSSVAASIQVSAPATTPTDSKTFAFGTPGTPAPVATPKSSDSGNAGTPAFSFGDDKSSKKDIPKAGGDANPSFSFGTSSTPAQAPSVAATGSDTKPSFSFGASAPAASATPSTDNSKSISGSAPPVETKPASAGPSGTDSSSAAFSFGGSTTPAELPPVTPIADHGVSKTAPSTATPAPAVSAPATPSFSFGGNASAASGAPTAPTTPAASFSFGGGGTNPATPASATPGFAFGAGTNTNNAGSTPAPTGGFSFNAGSTPAPPTFGQSAGGGAVNAARGRRRARRKGRL